MLGWLRRGSCTIICCCTVREMRLPLILSFCILCSYVVTSRCSNHETTACVSGCQVALRMIDFTDISPALHKTQKQCSGLLRLRSIYLCARKYCATSEELVPGFDRLNETCITYGDIALPPLTTIGSNISVTGDNQTYFQVVERHDFWGRLKVHFLAIPSQSLFEDALRTTVGSVLKSI
jgi:hypothetical protein